MCTLLTLLASLVGHEFLLPRLRNSSIFTYIISESFSLMDTFSAFYMLNLYSYEFTEIYYFYRAHLLTHQCWQYLCFLFLMKKILTWVGDVWDQWDIPISWNCVLETWIAIRLKNIMQGKRGNYALIRFLRILMTSRNREIWQSVAWMKCFVCQKFIYRIHSSLMSTYTL